jgi:hypothetical protein
MTDEHGDLLSVQLFEPGSARTGGLQSVTFDVRDGHRVWVIDDVLGPDDVEGHTSYGVQVEWPQAGRSTRYDPLELFHLPAPETKRPGTWSPWVVASRRARARSDGGAKPGGPTGAAAAGPQPELRCQVVATDTPGIVR